MIVTIQSKSSCSSEYITASTTCSSTFRLSLFLPHFNAAIFIADHECAIRQLYYPIRASLTARVRLSLALLDAIKAHLFLDNLIRISPIKVLLFIKPHRPIIEASRVDGYVLQVSRVQLS